jgi:endonuclease YncB( thermonuclease family)
MAEIIRFHRVARQARFRARTKTRFNFGFAMLCVIAFVTAAAVGSLALPHLLSRHTNAPPASAAKVVTMSLPICRAGRGSNCVIDGDTFRLDGQSIRIADIDTPETRDYACAAEKALGDRATARMRQLLNAGPFEVQAYERDEDQYGRKLRIITRGGRSLGQILVAEGLARNWDGARHPWC